MFLRRISPVLLCILASLLSFAQPAALDPTFQSGTGPDQAVKLIVQQRDGKLLMQGSFYSYNGITRHYLLRLNLDGTLDQSFTVDPRVEIAGYALAEQPDGKILVAGGWITIGGTLRVRSLIRLSSTGVLDEAFDQALREGPETDVRSIIVRPDGKILICGTFHRVNGVPQEVLALLNSDGAQDTAFHSPFAGMSNAYRLATQADGRILVGGGVLRVSGNGTISALARANADGTLDPTFPYPNAWTNVGAILPLPDGKILVSGSNSTLPFGRDRLCRLLPNGTIDPTFNAGGSGFGNNAYINSIAVQQDGKILAAGGFDGYNGVPRRNLLRLNADGSLDPSFDPGSGPDQTVQAVVCQADGKILIGGHFEQYNSISKRYLARLNGDAVITATSNIAPVEGLVVAPNPVRDWLFIQHPNETVPLQLRLINAAGAYCGPAIRIRGNGRMEMPLLPAGLYYLEIRNLKTGTLSYRKIVRN